MNGKKLGIVLLVGLVLLSLSGAQAAPNTWQTTITSSPTPFEVVTFGLDPTAADGYDAADLAMGTPGATWKGVTLALGDAGSEAWKKWIMKGDLAEGQSKTCGLKVTVGTDAGSATLTWSASPDPTIDMQIFNGTTELATSTVLAVGIHSLTVKATRKTIAPTVTVTSPTSGGKYSGSVLVQATATPDPQFVGSTVVSMWYNLDGGANSTPVAASTLSTTITPSAGAHTLNVYANDTGGNVGSKSVPFTVDNTAPTLTVTSPVEGTTYGSSSVSLAAALNEAGTIWCSVDGGTNSTAAAAPLATTLTGLADGAHTVTVYGADSAGNAATAKLVNFTVDTTAPTVSITAPTEGSTSDTSTVALAATATGAAQMWYSVDGGTNSTPVAGATLSANMAGLSNGDHNVTVYARDAVGNVGSAIVNFKVDTTTPVVTITSPAEGATTSLGVSLRATISKPASVWYNVDNGTNSTPVTATTSLTVSVTVSGAGAHNITVYAKDSVNQTGQKLVNFTVRVSGGGGLPPEAPTPTPTPVKPATQTQVLKSVSPTAPAVATFTDIGITTVGLNVNIDAENVVVNVEQTPEPPAGVPSISLSIAAGAGVYGYISITTTLPEGAVDSATVGFKVPKSWFTDNGFDVTSTGLQHYNEATGEWESLTTVQTGEDDEYYYFSAETPGFSVFSVIAEKEAAAPTETVPTPTPTPTKTGIPGFEAVLAIGAMLTIAYLVGRRTR